MGFPRIHIVHRTFCNHRTGERTTLWNLYCWLLVLGLAPVYSRTIWCRLPLHDRLGYILLNPLLTPIFPTTRQHQGRGI